ncbi:MAG: Superkiller protein 3, partial [Pleopsidium flavum]
NKDDEAARAYTEATHIKPNDILGWQGLLTLYERQDGRKIDEYRKAAIQLAELFMEADDRTRCQMVIDKYTLFVKKHGSRAQYKQALETLLPTSTVYDFLEGRIPHPSHTYIKIAEIVEAEEKERANKEIGERRTRLGAKIGQVTTEVKGEIFTNSSLEQIYQHIIDWSTVDEIRREYEEKLLRHAYDTLIVLPTQNKTQKREQVVEFARGMVIIKHPFALAWQITLEWKDGESLADWDAGILRDFIEYCPEDGLSKTLRGYLESEISPSHVPTESSTADVATTDEDAPMTAADRLLLITEGVEESPSSVLAHRIMGEYYLFLEEFESAVDVSRKAQNLVTAAAQVSGLKFQDNTDSVNIILACSLTHFQSPKNHPEAKLLFESILKRKPTSTAALIGTGLILEEQEDYTEALDFLSRALDRDPENARVKCEAAWCIALNGDFAEGLTQLESCLALTKARDIRTRDLKGLILYRIGVCLWNIYSSKAARKDRNGAYAQFLASLQANMNFAPAYTSLGIYYADYAKDKNRARKCFQKAIELSASEIEAAERLARVFADQGDWDLVEVVAQRVVDSGKVRPPPGSKRKGVSWPFAALGVVELNKQEYTRSIISFQSALRISPEDYHSWVGLGESYHNSGRYVAATKAFQQAEKLEAGIKEQRTGERWFAMYMLANVKRELGDHNEAIAGYEEVLKGRPEEFGVSIALLQTLVEGGWRSIQLGFFGPAADNARKAIDVAGSIAAKRANAFNLWKAVGDACSILSWAQTHLEDFPLEKVKKLLEVKINMQEYDLLTEVDGVGKEIIASSLDTQRLDLQSRLTQCLHLAILAHKRAIHAATEDPHAQAVAWYNLGWAEHRAHACLFPQHRATGQKESLKFLKAAMRCFKRAIELEAGNSDFWDSLGVVTTQLSPKVSQHAFVRSLYLNDKSARVWTNLGTLYLLQSDYQLANDAFTRAQSADPDYAHAWLGQGLLALLVNDAKEAQMLFTHAFEIADSSSLLTKRQYALSTFDHLSSSPTISNNITDLIQPLFALNQLRSQVPSDLPYQHLSALLAERIGNYPDGLDSLSSVCSAVEAEYEVSESPSSLARFAQAKADLARIQLARREYGQAAENAETALDLSNDEDAGALDPDARQKCRLSAHLTAGLAHYYIGAMDQAIEMFRAALEESDGAPDIVCLLAQVLWAKGGEQQRGVARDQLFDCVEKHPGHVGAITLLGVIAVLDGDQESIEAVTSDLQGLRANDGLDVQQQRRLGELLAAISALGHGPAAKDAEVLSEVTTSVMLSPSKPHGWTQLAEVSEEPYPAEMALLTATRAVPPAGSLDAE